MRFFTLSVNAIFKITVASYVVLEYVGDSCGLCIFVIS